MQLIDGKKTAEEIKNELAVEVEKLKKSGGKIPHLAAVLVGTDGASETYVANKVKACERIGFRSTLLRFDKTISEAFLLEQIAKLNDDKDIDGFIVQLPLPDHISEHRAIEAINPHKDVDGFHPINIGRTLIGLPSFVSATPAGIMELIKRYRIETRGKHCVIIGRSNIAGRPLSVLLSLKNNPGDATVTVCHSRTQNMAEITRQADILIAAIGKPGCVKSDLTKSGFKLKGDVEFEEVAPKCSFITPVPGGVGPMTIVSLLRNTLLAARREIYS
jgi:methylenetetrahydrofolate dehydrogenase (NADP+)/methenyltetrahydrofolate cyclohydrolase